MSLRYYLDHNATSALRPSVRDALYAAYDMVGNPSSIHNEGRVARAAIEEARQRLAQLIHTQSKNIVFTSGGTEASALALTPSLTHKGQPCARLLMSAGEHACVLSGHTYGTQAEILHLRPNGVLDLDHLRDVLAHDPSRAMVAVQYANNETGVIQPLHDIADIVHEHNGVLLVDAVQAFGRIDVSFAHSHADLMIISFHKAGGPKGVGALCFADDVVHIHEPPIRGGGQERGLRAGTENVQAISALSPLFAALNMHSEAQVTEHVRDEFEAYLLREIPDAMIFGKDSPRLPNTSAFAVVGVKAQTMLIALDLAGVSLSSGSACSSGKLTPSHVLAAMGYAPEEAQCALRLSLGWNTTREHMASVSKIIVEHYKKLLSKRQKDAA
jgi:cysteine desulfurase